MEQGPQASNSSDGGTGTPWVTTLWMMVAVQFIMTMAASSLTPILPLFLIQIHVHPLSAVETWSGIIASANFVVAALVSPLWGSLADRKGRKAMVVRSSAAVCVFAALMGLAQNPWELLGLRLLMGGFSGFAAAAIALVGTQVPENRLGFALGWLSTGQLIGGLVGPLAGGAVADWVQNYRVTFYFTALFALVAVLLVSLKVQEHFVPGTHRETASVWRSFRSLGKIQGLGALFVVLLLAQFATKAAQPVITLFVRSLVGPVPYLATLSGFAFSVTGLADLLASPFLGKRSDVLGYKRVLSIALAGATIFSVPQALVHNVWAFVAARFGLGLFIGGILPTANALIGRTTPRNERGRIWGMTASATFLGSFLGPLAGGIVSAHFGIRIMFVVVSACLLANLVWVRLRVQEPRPGPLWSE